MPCKRKPMPLADDSDEDYETSQKKCHRRAYEKKKVRRHARDDDDDQPSTSATTSTRPSSSGTAEDDQPSTSGMTSNRPSTSRAGVPQHDDIKKKVRRHARDDDDDQPSTSAITSTRPSSSRIAEEDQPSTSATTSTRPRTSRVVVSQPDESDEDMGESIRRLSRRFPTGSNLTADDTTLGTSSSDSETEFDVDSRRIRHLSQSTHGLPTSEVRIAHLQHLLDSDSDDSDDIRPPVVLMGEKVCHLGDENNKFDIRCPYCGALHFKTIYKKDRHRHDITEFIDVRDLICCDGGKVFVPPMKKRPEEIESLTDTASVKKMMISYNTVFSFASIQYHRIPSAPFGQPVAKTLGLIRHFPSAALPADPNNPHFGNLYLYTGDEAASLRMQGFSHLDPDIVADLQRVMERCHPFANVLRNMGSIIREERLGDGNEDLVRLRIIDAKIFPKDKLQGHQKLYRDPIQCGDTVAIFYNATVEQDVKLPGLIVYPNKNNKIPLPIFPWDPKINTLCYPLLFVFGEFGFKSGMLKLAEDPTVSYERRLLEWGRKNPLISTDWELEHSMDELEEELREQHRSMRFTVNDPNLQVISDISDDEEDDDTNDHLLHDLQSFDENGENERREVVERGGWNYPRPAHTGDEESDEDDDMEDYQPDDDLIRGIFHRDPALPVRPIPHRPDPNGDVEGQDLTPEQELLDFINVIEGEDHPTEAQANGGQAVHDEEFDFGDLGNEPDVDVLRTTDNDPLHRVEEMDPSEIHETRHRQSASLRQYGLYIHQIRKTFASDRYCARNRFTSSGKLGQVFLLDLATRMYQLRSAFQREHHTEYMTSTRSKFLQALQRRATRLQRTIGCVSTIPHTVGGSPRSQDTLYQRTIAMSRMRNGKPDLFITSTCDVNWPEIKNNIPPGDTWADHPMLVNEVFKKKYEQLLEMIIGKRYEKKGALRKPGIFGRVRWYSYSIEFQQRGPPHAHLIVSLKKHIKTAEQIDRVCQAELPVLDGTDETDELRKLVERFMIHRPCEGDQEAYCRQHIAAEKVLCRKNFPKLFSDTTKFGDSNYPELRRPKNGEHTADNTEADNRYVVAYNAQLLSFFRAHVNIEVVSNLSVVKYIFKYVFKGYDRVLVEAITSMDAPDTAAMTIEGHMIYPKGVTIPAGAKKQRELQAQKRLRENGVQLEDAAGKKVLVYDEYAIVEDQRALTGCEAAWDFQRFPRHGQSHTVVDLFVHGVHEEPVFYKKEDQEAKERELQEHPDVKTRLKEWFELNRRDAEARTLTYEELPTKYKFQNHKWRKRGQNRAFLFGRIKSVHPRNKEVFAIRLLCTVQKGSQSFEDLRTVNGVLHPTFVSAAMELGLMNNQMEWDRCLEEAVAERVPVTLRRLFASILVFNFVKNPVELWEKYKEHFYERNPSWSQEWKEAHALYHIDSFLRAHLTSLTEFHLPEFDRGQLPPPKELVDDCGMFDIDPKDALSKYEDLKTRLNIEQAEVFNRIIEGVEDPYHVKPFFIEGSGGAGKTHLMRTLFFALVGHGHKVAAVAHTGVAARLLPSGCTAHRRFHIPLTIEEDMTCKVEMGSDEAALLAQLNVVIWDEATMTDRRILQAVHRLMVDLNPEYDGILFGGVQFIFCGDWKQTLPIVPGTQGAAVVNYTMKGSDLWNQVEVLHLTGNMRAYYDPPFANWLAATGVGLKNIDRETHEVREEDQQIKIEYGTIVNSESELMTAVLGDLSAPPEQNRQRFESSAVLAVDNKTTFDVNEKALRMMPGETHTFLSVDEHYNGTEFTYLEPEIYHGETPTGMPPHELNVKVGCPVILLLNLNVSLGLVNGTRMIVEEIKDHIIWVSPLNPTKRTPKRVPLVRMLFSPTNVGRIERCFQRTQFPVRLAFSMTVNKSQGQTLDRVGILLRTPCFSHGQLYVALSRVRRSADLFIYNYKGMYEHFEQEKMEREKKKERAKKHEAKMKQRLERLKKKAKKEHKKFVQPEPTSESESSGPDDVVSEQAKRDERFYTNNVVFEAAIGLAIERDTAPF